MECVFEVCSVLRRQRSFLSRQHYKRKGHLCVSAFLISSFFKSGKKVECVETKKEPALTGGFLKKQ